MKKRLGHRPQLELPTDDLPGIAPPLWGEPTHTSVMTSTRPVGQRPPLELPVDSEDAATEVPPREVERPNKHVNSVSHRHPRGYFTDWDNFAREFLQALQVLGKFPGSYFELKQHGFGYLALVARRQHGGLEAIKQRLKFTTPITDEVLLSLADELAQAYLTQADQYAAFEPFVSSLVAECKTEGNLLLRLRAFSQSSTIGSS